MSRETTYFCDFSSQVAKHGAHFHVTIREAKQEIGADGMDACEKHLCAILTDWFRAGENDGTEPKLNAIVTRIPGIALPSQRQSGALSCEHCDGGPFKSEATRNAHLRTKHGVYQREAS